MPNKACGFYLLHLCVCAEYWTYGSLDLRMDAIPRCNFYLAESLIPGAGRAILAGKHFRIGDSLFDLPTLAVKKEHNRKWQLDNYVYKSPNNDYSMIAFGIASLFNHKNTEDANLGDMHSMDTCDEVDLETEVMNLPHSKYVSVTFHFKHAAGPGEEIFISYGDRSWFGNRNIPIVDSITPVPYDMAALEEKGICLTDVELKTSTLSLACKGVFARQDF